MTTTNIDMVNRAACLMVLLLVSCTKDKEGTSPQGAAPVITNRLDVGPEVVNNLGITFEKATRGKLGVWRRIPGQLEVPETKRWVLRSPASGRVVSVASRWQRVAQDEEVARLASPALAESQQAISLAQADAARAEQDLAAAKERLGDSEERVREARSFETKSRQRLDEIQTHPDSGNALLAKEVLELRRAVGESGRVTLDAAILRDDLAAKVRAKQIDLDQSRLSHKQELQRLSLLTGLPLQELTKATGDTFAWQAMEAIVLRAPSNGIVVELLASQGENVGPGATILQLFDSGELRFRGQLPEGDLGELAAGTAVRVEFPSRQLPAIETKLNAPLPIADPTTRMVLIEAPVPNPEGQMVHGISAIAQVLVRESKSEEVLIPLRCVVFDGLQAIVFKRDPNAPNVVIRTPIEMGARTTSHVEVLAGVLEGDAVVADGTAQLKQTGLGKAPEGGHFHADGTWHGEHK